MTRCYIYTNLQKLLSMMVMGNLEVTITNF